VAAKPAVLPASAAGVYLPEGRHPIIPFFQHSIIPIAGKTRVVWHVKRRYSVVFFRSLTLAILKMRSC
jgi:hypothetical protein